MGYRPKDPERYKEIVAFYYQIFGARVRRGMDAPSAKKEACDATTLRYGIASGTLLNIISSRKCHQDIERTSLKENAAILITELNTVNEGLALSIERNNKLISLLQECVNDNR